MVPVKCCSVMLIAIATLAAVESTAALTLEDAMDRCRAKYQELGDTEGAPMQHLAIEGCARQMVRESAQNPEPVSQQRTRRERR